MSKFAEFWEKEDLPDDIPLTLLVAKESWNAALDEAAKVVTANDRVLYLAILALKEQP